MPVALNQKHGTSNVLEVIVTGKLTHRDYETLVPMVEEMVSEFGKIRVLFDMVDFHGWDIGGIWDDTKFTFHHFADISRIAMVGDKAWEKGMSTFCKPFTKAEVRYFDRSEMERAREWLEAPHKETLGHAVAHR
jgi:hypothetical protein